MSSIYTVRPWPVSGRVIRTESTDTYYPNNTFIYWSSAVTYNDGTVKTGATYYDGSGYSRRGGSGRGAAINDLYRVLGYNKVADSYMRRMLAIPGVIDADRGMSARTVPTGRDRMRRLGIRPDVATRPDMTARERYTVEWRKARLAQRVPSYGDAIMAAGQAARNMPRRYGRYHGYDRTPWGASVGGYVVHRSQRGKPDSRRCYVSSPGQTAITYALEGKGRAADRRWNESYRRHVVHLASWRDRLPNPATTTAYYGDKIADVQAGIRNVDGSYIYPLRRNA